MRDYARQAEARGLEGSSPAPAARRIFRNGRQPHAAAGLRRAGAKSRLQGVDSLLSIVQMPAGVPVGTLAIGKAAPSMPRSLAARCLARSRPELRARLEAFRDGQTQQVLGDSLP